jgi:hypothetical protein
LTADVVRTVVISPICSDVSLSETAEMTFAFSGGMTAHGWITFLSSVAKVTADTVTTPQAESTATQRDIPDFK